MEKKTIFKIKPAFFLGVAIWVTLCLTGQAQASAESGQEGTVEKPGLFDAFLYFAAAGGGHLKAVPKQFPPGLDAHRLGRELLQSLLAGPVPSGFRQIFPDNTRVSALFITREGDAYVDLEMDPDGKGDPRPGDTITEYLAVYSLTNTLTVNIPQIRRVKILVNGAEASSFGGHISLDAFYKTNMLIVK